MTGQLDQMALLQQELQRLSQRVDSLQTTLDHIGTYVFMKDTEGRYTYANALVCELFNATKEDIIGKDDTHFFSLDISDDIRTNDRRVMNEGITIRQEEKNVIAATGETRYYMTVKSPLFNNDGSVSGMFGVSTDITERKTIELELRKKQALLDSILNNIDAHIYLKDKDYRFLYVNPKTESLFKLPLNKIVGKTGDEILPADAAAVFHSTDQKVFETGESQTGEERFKTEDGSYRYYWSIKVPMMNESGEVEKLIGFSTDITELAELRSQLQFKYDNESKRRQHQERLAITDPLTGLYNRLKLNESLNNEVARASRYQQALSIILLDIDFFKQVNDTYGHQVGDRVLVDFAKVVRQSIREADIVGRWGGEKFLVICPETDQAGAQVLANNLKKCIESHAFDTVKQKTASFGIASFQQKDTVENLLTRADKALYQAKQNGRNRVEVEIA